MALIAQLSDLHLTLPGRLLYGRIDTVGALRAAIARLLGLQPVPDLLVLSGDLVDEGSAAEYDFLRESLAPLPMPWALMPGNHDERTALRAAFPEQPWQGAELCCQRRDTAAGTLLLVDTVVPGESGGAIGDAQLAWLDSACPATGATLLFLHHPPFAVGIAGLDAIACRGGDRLAAWIARHPNVEALYCGHVHRPIVTAFAGRPAVCAPSPAHQIVLDLGGAADELAWTLEPGAMLLHDWRQGPVPVTHVVPVASVPGRRYAD